MKDTITKRNYLFLVAFAVMILLSSEASKAQILISKGMHNYMQDFNTLPVSGSSTWENGNFYIPGWTVHRTSTTTSLLTGTGSSNAGGLYSFGSSGSSDRALGAISSGSASVGQFAWGFLIQNKTGSAITALNVSFTGEQWRSASKTAGSQATTFWYSQSAATPDFNLSPLSDKGWTNVPELDFYSLVNFSAAGALDGNLPANKSYLAATIVIDIPDEYYIMLRWKDLNDLDDDHGLAIDDFFLTWNLTEANEPGVLPVELMYLRAISEAKVVKLEWATASESNSSRFNIERSRTGLVFETIGEVPAQGFSSQRIYYTFLDDQPAIGTSYYRLRQVDLDGKFTYSKVVTVKKAAPLAVALYPTITTQNLLLELPVLSDALNLSVYDKMGRTLISGIIPAQAASYLIDVGHLQNGYYFMILQNEIGQRQVLRFMKK